MRSIKNCNVCIVGGAGFLGSHLVNHLIDDRDCRVTVVDNLVVGRKEFVHEKAKFVHADITKSESYLRRVFTDHEFVFNYAAYPYIPDSFVRPLHVFEVNATGAMNVINAAQEAGCQGILQVSSAEIYGDAGTLKDGVRSGTAEQVYNEREADLHPKINEEFDVRPHSTYGVAKAAVDYFCQSAWKERQTPVIALRQFNCIGERETHPYIVPEIISQIHKELLLGKSMWPRMVKLGNNSTRDFQYAGDAVKMAVELLEKGSFGEVYNMGSEDSIKMYALAAKIGKLMGVEVHVNEDETRKRPWEIWHLQSDNSKLYSVIETRPTVTFDEALQKTIDNFHAQGGKWSWQ